MEEIEVDGEYSNGKQTRYRSVRKVTKVEWREDDPMSSIVHYKCVDGFHHHHIMKYGMNTMRMRSFCKWSKERLVQADRSEEVCEMERV